MNKFHVLIALAVLSGTLCQAQEAAPAGTAPKAVRVMGEVTAVDTGAITLKAENGSPVIVPLDDKTTYLRVPPGEQDLKKAAKINRTDIAVGDRVLARSRASQDQKPQAALSVIVMTKSDIEQKQAAERAEWLRRGVAGTVTAINPDTKEVSLKVKAPQGDKTLIMDSGEKVQFRRYAPDSVKFADAKPSDFAALKVGDMVRVLGTKNADETHITPEAVVSGSFHNMAGTITAIDTANGEIKVTNLETKKPMTVKVGSDAMLRRLPPQMASFLAARMQGGVASGGMGRGPGGGQGGATGGGTGAAPGAGTGGAREGSAMRGPGRPDGMAQGDRPRMGSTGGPVPNVGPGNASGAFPGGFQGGGAGGPGGGAGRGNGDLAQMLERMPPVALTDLKVGDAVIVASTTGNDPTRVTAITLLAGVEPLLTAPRQQEGRALNGGSWNLDINIVP